MGSASKNYMFSPIFLLRSSPRNLITGIHYPKQNIKDGTENATNPIRGFHEKP